jgi:hypothetical protein
MSKARFLNNPDPNQLAKHVEKLRTDLADRDPAVLARQTGTQYQLQDQRRGVFDFSMLGQAVQLGYPAWVVLDANSKNEVALPLQALALYYFTHSDGAPIEQRWISFADLPDGRFYNQAYQGYTGRELGRNFQNDIEAFTRASLVNAGILLPTDHSSPGDCAFLFHALPRVSILVAYWLGDEDFPASAQVLFPASVPHYLPTDVCAFLGSTITRRLIKSRSLQA